MYVLGNPKTKKQLKEWVASGKRVEIFAPGLGSPIRTGVEYIEGPHETHSWYARVQMKDGAIVKILQ